MATNRPIDLQELSKYFKMPEKAVAKSLGICLTSLKKICRAHGVTRWPYRKIKSLDKKLKKLEVAMNTAKDDPSMVYAKWGSGEDSSFCHTPSACSEKSSSDSYSCSPTPSSEFASMASTPRQSAGPVCDRGQSPVPAPSPLELESDLQAEAPAIFFESEETAFMDDHTGVMHPNSEGCDDAAHASATDAERAASPSPSFQPIEHGEEPYCGRGGCYERSPSPDVSDEDLIAMLAQCAGTEGAGTSARPHHREGSVPSVAAPESAGAGCGRGDKETDEEIMQALAGCCSFPCAMDEDEGHGDFRGEW